MEDNFIVAIELGSSKVTCMAGRKQPDGRSRAFNHFHQKGAYKQCQQNDTVPH